MPDRPPPDLPGVAHHWAEVDGVRLHWAEAGDPDAPVVVLLHGWPQHWYAWRHQVADLRVDHRVVVPDLRGHGWSAAPPGGYDKQQLGRDVMGLLDQIGVDRFHLVGHDWGCWTGFLLCLGHPDRVRTFTGMSTPPPFQRLDARRAAAAWRFWYQLVVAAPGLGRRLVRGGALLSHVLRRWGTAGDLWSPDELALYVDRLALPDRDHVSTALYRTFLVHELPDVLRGRYADAVLEVPAQLLVGSRDRPVSPALLQGQRENAPELRIEVVEGAGHFLPEECPELVSRRIRELVGTA